MEGRGSRLRTPSFPEEDEAGHSTGSEVGGAGRKNGRLGQPREYKNSPHKNMGIEDLESTRGGGQQKKLAFTLSSLINSHLLCFASHLSLFLVGLVRFVGGRGGGEGV